MAILLNQPLHPARGNTSHPALAGGVASILAYGDANLWQINNGNLILPPTISGALATTATPIGSAFSLNGSSSYLTYPTANVPTQEFTVIWGGTFGTFANFRGLVDCSSGANGWNIFESGTDTLFFSINGYGGISALSGWTPGQFWHGAVRWKTGGEHAWFRNGIKQSTKVDPIVPGTAINPLRVFNHYAGGTSLMLGSFAYFYLIARWLDDNAIASIHQIPWGLLQEEPRVRFYPAATPGSSGTVNYTNANDTVSASGTTTVIGSLATTNANDTCAASGTSGSVSGTVAYTNADDTSAASGTTTVTGSLARTNANDTVSASGTTTIVGSSVTTNANDTCAASGSVGNAVSGSVNYTNTNDLVSASGTTTVTGSLSRTNSNDTVAASGTTTVLGSSSTTNANDTLLASGIVGSVTGTVAYTNNNDACAASGTAGNPQQGGHYGGATLDRKRKKERRHDDPDKAELRRSLENLVDGKVEQLKEEITQPEIPQEIKNQAAKIIKAYQKPGIDLTVINNDIEEIKTLLQAEIRRQQDEDEELLFMLL